VRGDFLQEELLRVRQCFRRGRWNLSSSRCIKRLY